MQQWVEYFRFLVQLGEVKFPRSFKPENVNPIVKPDLVTFSDGNPHAFGTVAYIIWTLNDGLRESRLVGSKAKLAQILKKSETVRNELNGTTFSSKFKNWIFEQTGISFASHYPIVDSRIVQAMIKKDSYSLDTFTGLRVSEIQKSTNVDCWLHVPSRENVSDVLTKGAPPSSIDLGSVWQSGSSWLIKCPSQWPITDVESDPVSASSFSDFLAPVRKSKVYTSKVHQFDLSELFGLTSDNFNPLVTRFFSLPKLIRVVAYVLRCALMKRNIGGTSRGGKTQANCL